MGCPKKLRIDVEHQEVGQDLEVAQIQRWVVWIMEVWEIMDHLEVAQIQAWVVWIMEVWQIMAHLEVTRIQPWVVWIMDHLMEEWEVWEIMENEKVFYKVDTLLN